ncbi:MAG: glycosyltransferase [Bacteroidia bacterium]|nr:glycosyltransferase [Bacteroidia bacterium]
MNECQLDVLMITYNHEDYIEEAISGVIKQVTDFNFRLLIFDDYSTDETEERIKTMITHNNPNLKIEYHRNNHNIGMMRNGMQSFESVTSPYIAICEGDDYWVDPFKIQKQVDFLEKNQNIVLTCGNSITIDENGGLISDSFLIDENVILNTENIIGNTYYNFIPTASILFRNIINSVFLQELKKLKAFDWSLLFLLSIEGDFYFDKNILSAYRITGKGVSSKLSEVDKIKMSILLYDLFRCHRPEYETIIKHKVDYCFELIKYIYDRENETLIHKYETSIEFLKSELVALEDNISIRRIIILVLKKIKKKIRINSYVTV